MAKFDSILGTVGRTPVVRINKLAPKGVNLYVKIEAFNPLGSVSGFALALRDGPCHNLRRWLSPGCPDPAPQRRLQKLITEAGACNQQDCKPRQQEVVIRWTMDDEPGNAIHH